MNRVPLLFCAILLFFAAACSQEAYDISSGIDKEITLFTDEVSVPLGDVGPLTPKALLDKSGLGDMLKNLVKEDEEGYMVIEEEGQIYSNPVMLVAFFLPDQTQPADLPVNDYSGNLGSMASALASLGLSPSPQVFSLLAGNPLTEEIAVSGRLTLSSSLEDESTAETIVSQEFSRAKVAATTPNCEILRVERTGGKAFYDIRLDNLIFHLPGSMLEKDPAGGFGGFSLAYKYKSYLALTSDFPESIPFDISDLDLPLAQYKVKEARIRTDVSSEIPVTLEVASIGVLVKKTDEDGNESTVVSDNVSVSPGLRIASGRSGNPVVSPLEIVIKTQEGTIPDISGLRLSFSIKAPAGTGDNRLNLNQAISFNNLRATVSGGITFQGL